MSSNTTITLNNKEEKKFTFDGVKGEGTSQEEIFSSVGRSVLDNCMKGYNGTIFAYGQTGSGKTYTMTGLLDDDDNIVAKKRGLMPRCFEHLFSLVSREISKKGDRLNYLVTCSFLEIYNERIFDLLDAGCTGKQLREDVKRGVTIPDLTELTVRNALEACEVLKAGSRNRRVGSTSMNRESSRSHAVFTVGIKSLEADGDLTNIKESKLHMIDLAGSERQRDTNAGGDRLKEAGNINKSLSALGNVIMALVDVANGKTRHVAYRDSKLTFLLRDSLGGNTKTFMIANISPAAQSFGETLSTLQFAQRAKMIKNNARVNENTAGNIKVLQAEIQRLKEMLQSGDGTALSAGAPGVGAGPMDGGQQQLFISALKSRDDAERAREAAEEAQVLSREKAAKLEKALQSTKMIVKFRDAALAKLRKGTKGATEGDETNPLEARIHELEAEVNVLKEMNKNHPDVTRFAMKNLTLREKLTALQEAYPEHAKENQKLVDARSYTHQLEQHIVELTEKGGPSKGVPSTPVSGRGRVRAFAENVADSPRAKRNADVELEKFRMEKELENKIKNLTDQLSRDKVALATIAKAAERRETELQAELTGANKSLKELENTIRVLQMRHETEVSRMKDAHMMRLERAQAMAADAESGNSAIVAALEEELNAQRTRASEVATEAAEQQMVLNKLQQELHKAEGQCTMLRDRCSAAEDAAVTAQQEADAMSMSLTTELGAANDAMAKLRFELEKSKENAEHNAAKYATRIAKLQSDLELSRQDAEELEEDTAAAIAQKERVEAELETERTQRLNLADEVETLRAEADFKEDELLRKEAVHTEVKKGAAHTASRLAALENELESLKNAAAAASGAENDAQDALAAAVAEAEDRARKIESIRDAQDMILETLKSKVTDLNHKLTKEHELAAVQANMASKLKADLTDAREMAAAKDAELNEVYESIDRLTQQAQADGDSIAQLEMRLATAEEELEAEHTASQRQVQEILEELDTMHDNFRRATTDRDLAEEALSEFQRKAEPILSTAAQHEKEAAEAKAANIELEEKVSRLHDELTSASAALTDGMAERHAAHQAEVAALKKQCEDAAELLQTTETFKEAKVTELTEVRKELAALKTANSRLDEVERLRGAAEAKAASMSAALAEAEEKLVRQNEEVKAIEEMRKATDAKQQKTIAKLQADKAKVENRRAMCEANLDAALEDAEALVDELQRSRALEQSLYKEKEELKSKFEQSQEGKLEVEEELAKAQTKLVTVRGELDKMMAHSNPNQKIHLHMQIKRENNDLKKEIARLQKKVAALRPPLGEHNVSAAESL
eukprot:CAMPEP_0206294754 /NCGR_PEP_ID=MMETSP0106_2-20121207/4819_1 /ASSEMBLY_ACC=CAM_ASM_000206 /TAXON_ID=81532 /ORGANISM="Acanthoeca-like sp., Strain 10tr" /LENGTH=1315 /DNA_ID=CAMNT_0053725397 /DNA_START=71 /DNA_END=4018 /DNA_ORIENTATION=+